VPRVPELQGFSLALTMSIDSEAGRGLAGQARRGFAAGGRTYEYRT